MNAGNTLTATMSPAINEAGGVRRPRHFALELLGLILRILATALAINIVLAGLVLLLAGQAGAADAPALSPAGELRTGETNHGLPAPALRPAAIEQI